MIDLVFYGRGNRRSKSEQQVLDAWHEYHNHLNIKADDSALTVWAVDGDKFFTDLLVAIAQDVNYKFDRVQLKTSVYSPMAHGELEAELNATRNLTLELLTGKRALKMDVEKFPVDPDALKAQIELQQAMSGAFTGDGALNVHVRSDNTAR